MTKPLHPFPARMAPDVALRACESVPAGSLVLDPMAGSGTVLRLALDQGHNVKGFDLDPLAVLISRVWTSSIDKSELIRLSEEIVSISKADCEPELPWIDSDEETRRFAEYWFGPDQRSALRRIAKRVMEVPGGYGDALKVSLSRIIITKKNGASLAWDVSHSRPHRVNRESSYDVFDSFAKSCKIVAGRIPNSGVSSSSVELGDCRNMHTLENDSIDLIVTSPPYLNALDYMRGHKLALIWLGYDVGHLRSIRRDSVGAERKLESKLSPFEEEIYNASGAVGQLGSRESGFVRRFSRDAVGFCKEAFRVLRPNSSAVLVIGNSTLRGTYIRTSHMFQEAMVGCGFSCVEVAMREIPENKRYLPVHSRTAIQGVNASSLQKRMRHEYVLTFVKHAD